MRRLLPVLMMLTLTGCLPLSVNPLYTGEDDVVFDEALLGQWTAGPQEKEFGTWLFEVDAEHPNRYALSITDKDDRVAKFRATLVQVGDRRFLDLEPLGVEPDPQMNGWFAFHLMPMRSFMRITVADGGLAVAFADVKELDKLLKANPELVAYTRTTTEAGGDRVLFTADSASLQAFVRDQLDDDTFFDDGQMLVPVAEEAPEPEPAAPDVPATDEDTIPALYD